MNFSDAAKAQIEGRTVRFSLLSEFRFASGNVNLWMGFGDLRTLDGRTWRGTREWGSIDGLSQSINGSAPQTVFTLSGVDATFAAKAKAEAADYYNHPAVTYLQFFTEDWACLDNPYPLTANRMTNITAKMQSDDNGNQYAVALTAETPFATRRRPRFGYYTDTDQQQRFAGDRGLERMTGIDNKLITFPDY